MAYSIWWIRPCKTKLKVINHPLVNPLNRFPVGLHFQTFDSPPQGEHLLCNRLNQYVIQRQTELAAEAGYLTFNWICWRNESYTIVVSHQPYPNNFWTKLLANCSPVWNRSKGLKENAVPTSSAEVTGSFNVHLTELLRVFPFTALQPMSDSQHRHCYWASTYTMELHPTSWEGVECSNCYGECARDDLQDITFP